MDFNNDGRKDLFIACGGMGDVGVSAQRAPRQPNPALMNLGGREFQDVSAAAGLSVQGIHRGAAFGDFGGDGRVDAVGEPHRREGRGAAQPGIVATATASAPGSTR